MFSVSMALLMILSSTGVSIDAHYCQDQLRGISLFGEVKSCHDKQEIPPCHQTKKTCHRKEDGVGKTDNDNCCHNETVIIEKSDSDASNIPIATAQDIQLEFVAAFVAVYILNYTAPTEYQNFVQYKPPLPDRGDVQVLYQTFLI